MNILEIIGILTILGLVFLGIKKYFNMRKNENEKFKEKVKILVDYHPELNNIFREYLKNEQNRISKSYEKKYDYDDYDDGYRGGKKIIFGHEYNVYYHHIDIEHIIINRIKELEKDANGQEEISNFIKLTKANNLELIKKYEVKLYELNAKLLKYGKTLKLIFPNNELKLDKEDIIEKLLDLLKVTPKEAEFIFYELTYSDTKILHEHFETISGPKTGKYWFSEYVVNAGIKNAKTQIEYLTFKYH